MTQEEKQLLLKDFCTRLPYGVMFDYNNNEPLKVEGIVRDMVYFRGYNYRTGGSECYADITRCKPYLRPMSNMTEEEYNKYELTFDNVVVYSGHNNNNIHSEHRPTYETFDYLDSIHVDYRDLIPKGLALPAPEGMYNIK